MKTKKATLIILISILNTAISFAQEWAPIGATWHYQKNIDIIPSEFYTGYTKMESIKDTALLGKSCKIILETYDDSPYGNSYLDTDSTKYYMYSDTNNKVYYFSKLLSKFCLLYDFNAVKGDSFSLDCYENTIVHIDSTAEEIINGKTIKKQRYSIHQATNNEFGGWVLNNIGNLSYMFPIGNNYEKGPLRCYEDTIVGFYQNGNIPCEYTTSIENKKNNYELRAYPNPFKNNITVKVNKKVNNTILYNIIGEEQNVRYNIQNDLVKINTATLKPGIYFLNININNTNQYIKLEKNENN